MYHMGFSLKKGWIYPQIMVFFLGKMMINRRMYFGGQKVVPSYII